MACVAGPGQAESKEEDAIAAAAVQCAVQWQPKASGLGSWVGGSWGWSKSIGVGKADPETHGMVWILITNIKYRLILK